MIDLFFKLELIAPRSVRDQIDDVTTAGLVAANRKSDAALTSIVLEHKDNRFSMTLNHNFEWT
jgi:hypothetical protein